MIKHLIIVLFVSTLFVSLNVEAQKSFEKGDVLLSPGIGWGTRVGASNFFWPNVIFNADFGVHDYVSVGPYAAVAFGGNRYNAYSIGACASFHWWQLLDDKVAKDLKQDQIDFYLPFWLGARILTNHNGSSRSNGFDAGLGLGLRWYPNANQRFALYGEWGRGPISWGSVGMTIKVN
ncbi:MAG: hypothetical protein R2753_08140 [Chitinophagales bacterium]